jgi:hypothetical protein
VGELVVDGVKLAVTVGVLEGVLVTVEVPVTVTDIVFVTEGVLEGVDVWLAVIEGETVFDLVPVRDDVRVRVTVLVCVPDPV